MIPKDETHRSLSLLIARTIDCSAIVRLVIGYLLIFCLSIPASALSKDDDIDTNRPSFTDSAIVVPQGSLQLENGTLYQHFQHGLTYFDIPENEVRLGLTQRTEFQMFTPNYVLFHSTGASSGAASNSSPSFTSVQTSTAGTQTGVSDLNEIGIKQQIGPFFNNLNLSVIGGLNVPTGRRLVSGTGVQPVVRAPWSKGLSKNWSIGGMQSLLVLNSGRDIQWQNFFVLNRAFGARTSTFVEYAGFYTHHTSPSNIIHFGAVRKLNRNNQIDLQFGFGLNKTAPAALFGIGYSFRFDYLPLIEGL